MNQEGRDTGRDGGPPGSGIDFKRMESVLLEMGKSLRAISIYPPGHPQRGKILAKACGDVQKTLGVSGDMSFQVARNGFTCNDQKIAENQQLIAELAQEMHLRQVKSFSLRRELNADDFTALLDMLVEKPENFRKGRFIEQWIRARQIRTVWINEIDFSRLTTTAGPAEESEEQAEEASPEKQIQDILRMLEREDDPERFGQLLRELEIHVRPLIEEKDYNRAWQIIRAVSYHATGEKRPVAADEQIRALTMRILRALIKEDFLKAALNLYMVKEGQDRASIHRVLYLLGPSLIDEVMAFISQKESIAAYRPLMGLVLAFEDQAGPILEEHLQGDNPVSVRKAAFLLGELRSGRSVDAIKRLLDHDDTKVRREAIRSLVRIRGMAASRALAAALQKESDPEFRMVIVSALGESKAQAGVPALLGQLKSIPAREDTLLLLEATIDALGRIGSKEALPQLIKVLNKKSLFQRDVANKLRIRAAVALGMLGGESAMQALARYARGGDDPLKKTCTAVLEELVKNDGRPVTGIEDQL
jgi:HEAT repeat protein